MGSLPAALGRASQGTSGDMNTLENNFEMELLNDDRDEKTDVSYEESDKGEVDKDIYK